MNLPASKFALALLCLTAGCAAPQAARNMTALKPIDLPFPDCTDEQKAHHFSGKAVFHCLITETGDVRGCDVKQPLPPMTESILDALSRAKFEPIRHQGKPIAVGYTFNFTVDCKETQDVPAPQAPRP